MLSSGYVANWAWSLTSDSSSCLARWWRRHAASTSRYTSANQYHTRLSTSQRPTHNGHNGWERNATNWNHNHTTTQYRRECLPSSALADCFYEQQESTKRTSLCLLKVVVLSKVIRRIVWGETKYCLKSNNEAFHLPLHTIYTINNKKKHKNTEKYMAKVCIYQIKSLPLHRFSLWEGKRII